MKYCSLSAEQISEMISLQDKINTLVNPHWKTANNDWLRAMRMEAFEAIDHYGWKWWKLQEKDIPQTQLELVDIWHFILSHAIVVGAEKEFCSILEEHEIPAFFIKVMKNKSIVEIFEIFIEQTFEKNVPLDIFSELMRRVDLSWDELYFKYVGKNVLNIFRQLNGYKDETYIKTWHGQEDNVHMMTMIDELRKHNSGDISNLLMQSLSLMYSTVKN